VKSVQQRAWLWLGILFATVAQASDPPTLLRTTLMVKDVERTIDFYGQLGFTVESDRGGPRKPDSPFPLAAAAKTFRLVILATADPAGGKIGLLAFGDPEPPVAVPAHPKLGIGDMVFVVRVDDVTAAYRRFKDKGAALVEPAPVAYEMKRPDGTLGRRALFHVFDPDGRLVEVMAPAPTAGMDAPLAGK
jgi:catechol 2,3-dioxygenase-like lactoylglutathione lyase family enzyme